MVAFGWKGHEIKIWLVLVWLILLLGLNSMTWMMVTPCIVLNQFDMVVTWVAQNVGVMLVRVLVGVMSLMMMLLWGSHHHEVSFSKISNCWRRTTDHRAKHFSVRKTFMWTHLLWSSCRSLSTQSGWGYHHHHLVRHGRLEYSLLIWVCVHDVHVVGDPRTKGRNAPYVSIIVLSIGSEGKLLLFIGRVFFWLTRKRGFELVFRAFRAFCFLARSSTRRVVHDDLNY